MIVCFSVLWFSISVSALPETNNDIQFCEIKKSTGRMTLQLVINGGIFWKRLDASGVGKKAYFKSGVSTGMILLNNTYSVFAGPISCIGAV